MVDRQRREAYDGRRDSNEMSENADGDEPRILDKELGKRLGFGRPRSVRRLILRMRKEGALDDFDVGATPSTAGAVGRPGIAYRLTDHAAQLVSARSHAKLALVDDLYIIESSCGWFKIGRSVDVSARLKGLELQCPPSVTLELIAVASGYGAREHALHEAFDEYRERGEWFSPRAGGAIRRAIAGGLEAFIQRIPKERSARPARSHGKQPIAARDTKRLARTLAVRLEANKRLRRKQAESGRSAVALPVPTDPAQRVLPFPTPPRSAGP